MQPLLIALRQGQGAGVVGQPGVESGIEACYLGYFRQLFADRRDAGQCRRQMQGCKRYECMQSGQQVGRDALGPDVLAAVHHAVTDGIHVRQVRVS